MFAMFLSLVGSALRRLTLVVAGDIIQQVIGVFISFTNHVCTIQLVVKMHATQWLLCL